MYKIYYKELTGDIYKVIPISEDEKLPTYVGYLELDLTIIPKIITPFHIVKNNKIILDDNKKKEQVSKNKLKYDNDKIQYNVDNLIREATLDIIKELRPNEYAVIQTLKNTLKDK